MALSLFLWAPVQAQDISYRQYTVKDGLPGSTVYQSLQDLDGFIWFATNQGVSRFDGRTFKNFTKKDGLPDNEIIKLYIDKHNAIWFISLSGIPAVYYKGTIRSLDCQGVASITEDKLTDSIFLSGKYFKNNGSYYGYYASVNEPGRWRFTDRFRKVLHMVDAFNLPMLGASGPGASFYFSVVDHQKSALILKHRDGSDTSLCFNNVPHVYLSFTASAFVSVSPNKNAIVFHNFEGIYYADSSRIQKVLSLKKIDINIDKITDLSSLYFENDTTLWICTRNKGLIKILNFMKPERTFRYYFVNSFCTSILRDREGGYWLTTHNEGVFYWPNPDFYTLSGHKSLAEKDVRCIKIIDPHTLAAGYTDGAIIKIDPADVKVEVLSKWALQNKNNRVLDISTRGNGLVIGSDGGLFLLSSKQVSGKEFKLDGIKGILKQTDSTYIIASASGLHYHKLGTTTLPEIYRERATCITGNGHQYYWGSLQGVYMSSGDSIIALGKLYPALAGIINYVALAPDSSVWVATQQGVVILKDGITNIIKEKNGLPANTCRHLFLDGNTAWIATDKGIARINYRWQEQQLKYSITNVTENDGLVSDDVNQVAVAGRYVWAATARGISFFSRSYNGNSSLPPFIMIDRVVAGNAVLPSPDTVHLDYRKNNLTVEIAGVAYHNARNIRYQYRLKELDSTWYPVINNNISFSALPYGQYKLEIAAFNRALQIMASSKQLLIINKPPFWKTTWFIVLVYLWSTLMIGVFFYLFYRRRQQKKDRLQQVNKKIHDLEVMALRAQMNPHFIFNCLNSIQHYILTADVLNANLYLHRFSMLIRKTLQLTPASLISLNDEVEMLELYLELEQMRQDDRMDYRIIVQADVSREDCYIPSMIIQPYVENAVKHGIAPLRDRKGIITVEFRMAGEYLECLIEDNGIGINAALQRKQVNTYKHISMGQNITEGRLQAMNSIREKKIKLQVSDRHEIDPLTAGTLVRILFPTETE